MKNAQKSMKKHSPEILTGIGIAGMIATTVSAVRATPKALQLIDAREIKENRRLSNKEIIATTWKCYVPAAVTGVLSTACLVGASSANLRRNTALATAYSISETALVASPEALQRHGLRARKIGLGEGKAAKRWRGGR